MRAFIVLFLVLAAAGTFYLVTQSGPDSATSALNVDNVDTASDAAPDETTPAVLQDFDASENGRSGRNESLAAPPEIPTNAAPEGSTAVVGTVENPQGGAVVGAKVTLTRFSASTLFFHDATNMDHSTDLSTTTDAKGLFTFTEVPIADSYALIVDHDDYARREEGPFEVHEGEQVQQVIILKAGTLLHGTVTDTGGNPVPSAQLFLGLSAMGLPVALSEDDPTLQLISTNATGQFEFKNLASGSYMLSAVADGYGRMTLQQLNVTADGDVQQDLVLDLASALGGSVKSITGEPIEGAKVEVYSISNRTTRTQTQTFTDERGEFLVQDVPDGDYSLRVAAEGYRAEPWTRASTGEMGITIQLGPQPRIRGRVLDSVTKQPLTSFTLNLRQGVANSDYSIKVQNTTKQVEDAEGRFELNAPMKGEYQVEASAPGYAPSFSASFTIEDGQELPGLSVFVDRGGSIVGRIVDSKGAPIRGALIKTNNNHWTGTDFDRSMGDFFPGKATQLQGRSNANGEFSINGLTPATYLLEIGQNEHSKTVLKDVLVAVGRETNVKEIVMSTGASVSGSVRGPSGQPLRNATVTLQLEAARGGFPITYTAKSGREGAYTFKHVRGGTYFIHATRPSDNQGNPFAGAMDIKQSRRKVSITEGGDHQGEDFDLAN
ncbi:MAG: protocatechuate 3,4-dioxygenase beta subunit [Planctomycetota bacterium]|jgi:protocatechuate 3,4-dioxygenase beta subunit/5-hydroxyisourate hydrolase-like protein (transthyretin family)